MPHQKIAPAAPINPAAAQFAARVTDTLARLALDDARGAEYLGVPVPTLRKWRAGVRAPSAAVIRLLDVLGTVEALAPALHSALLPENRVMSKNPESSKPARRSPRNRVMSKNPETLEVAQQ